MASFVTSKDPSSVLSSFVYLSLYSCHISEWSSVSPVSCIGMASAGCIVVTHFLRAFLVVCNVDYKTNQTCQLFFYSVTKTFFCAALKSLTVTVHFMYHLRPNKRGNVVDPNLLRLSFGSYKTCLL